MLDPELHVRLLDAIGFKGRAVKALGPKFATIRITQTQADTVFQGKVLREYAVRTITAFPGVTQFSLDV